MPDKAKERRAFTRRRFAIAADPLAAAFGASLLVAILDVQFAFADAAVATQEQFNWLCHHLPPITRRPD